jgi:hypothetical protein
VNSAREASVDCDKKPTDVATITNPFAANNIYSPRYIWDPRAHRYFGEECSFFFVRFRETHGAADLDALDRADAWLHQFDIQSKYIYKLFGYYDVMVRIWAPATRLTSFRHHLRSLGEEVLAVKEFAVARVQLVLSESRVDQLHEGDYSLIKQNLEPISRLFECSKGIQNPDQREALSILVERGLVYRVTGCTEEGSKSGFRFSCVIKMDDLQGARINIEQVLDWIAQYNHQARTKHAGVIRCAVYSGDGFGDFMISGLISDHDTLVYFSSYITRALEKLRVRCRTETHITAGSESIELDVINPSVGEYRPEEIRMLAFLASQQVSTEELAEAGRSMQKSAKERVLSVFSKFEFEFVASDFSRYFQEFLLAKVMGNQVFLQRAMMCLLELEGLLSRAWQNACNQHSAHGSVLAAAVDVGLGKVDIKKLTLKQMIDISGKLQASGAIDWLLNQLGMNWQDILRDLTSVRNDVAHGVLFADATYLTRKWDELASQIGIIGRLYNRTRLLLTGSNTTKEAT